jgi:hypothetical protein
MDHHLLMPVQKFKLGTVQLHGCWEGSFLLQNSSKTYKTGKQVSVVMSSACRKEQVPDWENWKEMHPSALSEVQSRPLYWAMFRSVPHKSGSLGLTGTFSFSTNPIFVQCVYYNGVVGNTSFVTSVSKFPPSGWTLMQALHFW